MPGQCLNFANIFTKQVAKLFLTFIKANKHTNNLEKDK